MYGSNTSKTDLTNRINEMTETLEEKKIRLNDLWQEYVEDENENTFQRWKDLVYEYYLERK